MKEVDLVLSGSSTKYPCHVGFIKGIQELEFDVRRLALNSGGSMIGGFYAAGMSMDEMMDMTYRTDICGFLNKGFLAIRRLSNHGYLSNGWRFYRFLKKKTGKKKLRDIDIPIFIMASNFSKYELHVFTQETDPDVLLADAIYMSCTMPGAFMPIVRDGDSYRDGGIHKDFPWDIWTDCPRTRIGHLIAFSHKMIVDQRSWSGFMELAAYGANVSFKNVKESLDKGPKEPDGYIVESYGMCLPAFRLAINKDQRMAMIQEGYHNTMSKLSDIDVK